MEPEVKENVIVCIRRNADVFAIQPSHLKVLDPQVAMHVIHEDPSVRHVKQKMRRFGVEKDWIIVQKVEKLLEAGHIREVQFPIWLSNAVIFGKEEGKWRMCIDFRDLDKACPKDHYPLPRIDQLVDATSGCELLSMMEAYQGYHQVKMYLGDIAKTTFGVCCGIFSFASMPFGLKNDGVTYQRMMDVVFKKQIGRIMAVYVDGMLIKSQRADQHEEDLEKIFRVIRKNRIMLNPTKCTFGVKAGKFLGYMVTERGIEVNRAKVEANLKLTPPRSIREIQALNGRVIALSRFISRVTDRSLPFFEIFQRKGKFEWTEECQTTFEELKEHLAELPLLVKPIPGEVLYLYIAVGSRSGSSLLVKEEEGAQKPIYFMSHIL